MTRFFKHPTLLFGGILFLGVFLLVYRLSELMMFIGDFGWFYLSARDMVLTGNIPLVGIPSSHPWLNQGPFWTYLLGIGLAVSNFHPLSGAIIAILFGIGSIFLIYLTAKELFSERAGLIAALLYSTSPLVIIHARMPYHTAPIPFFTLLLFYATYRWIKGNRYFFPVALFSLSVLYNLELATVVFWFLFIGIILFGIVKKQQWAQSVRNPKIFAISFVSFLFPLIPILIYDSQNGFPQTVRFAVWTGYKVLTLFGYPPLRPEVESASFISVASFFFDQLGNLLFLPNVIGALVLFTGSIILFANKLFDEYKRKEFSAGNILLGLFFLVGLGGFFAAKTTSEAYLPMLFPAIILLTAHFMYVLFQRYQYTSILVVVLIATANISSLLAQNYLMAQAKGGYGPTFAERLQVAERIVKTAGKNEYTIKGRGKGSEFRSYTMNYEYLTWWLGHGPSRTEQPLQFIIQETPQNIYLEVRDIEK